MMRRIVCCAHAEPWSSRFLHRRGAAGGGRSGRHDRGAGFLPEKTRGVYRHFKGTIYPWRFTVPVSGRYIPLIPLPEHRKPICSTDYCAGLRA